MRVIALVVVRPFGADDLRAHHGPHPQRDHVLTGDVQTWSVDRCSATDHRHTVKIASLIQVAALEAINERAALEGDATPDRVDLSAGDYDPGPHGELDH